MNEIASFLLKNTKKAQLSWRLIQFKKIFENDIKLMSEYIEPTEEFKKFEEKRVSLCQIYCDKNDDGTPKIVNNTYVGLEKSSTFKDELGKLREEYKEEVAQMDEKFRYYETAILNETVEFDKILEDSKFKKIQIELIPEDLVTGDLLEVLQPILTD